MKAVVLTSGGIDSPAAAYLTGARSWDIILLHMDNRPFTDDLEIEKVPRLRNMLEKALGKDIELWFAPFGTVVQKELSSLHDRHLQCVHCRRMMLRIAEAFAREHDCGVIVTGESLGQVASQTLRNISVEERAISTPVVRPLIGMDKEEVIDIAKGIDTFGTSTSHGLCCTMTPSKPATGADPGRVEEAEKALDIEGIVTKCMEGMEEIPRE